MKKIFLPVIILSGLGIFAYCCTPNAAISKRARGIVDTTIVTSDSTAIYHDLDTIQSSDSTAIYYDLDTIQTSDYSPSKYDMDTTMVIDTVRTEVL